MPRRSRSKSPKRSSEKKAKWSKVQPKTIEQRREMLKVCGPKCFGDPDELKYPWCGMKDGKPHCVPVCSGVSAAQSRAHKFSKSPKRKIRARAEKTLEHLEHAKKKCSLR